MAVPNAPAGQYIAAINPTGNGATYDNVPDAPLVALPAVESAVVDWDPIAPSAPTLGTDTSVQQMAGILDADGNPVAGSGGPPYVAGNVTVGDGQVGTNVILLPE